MADVVEFTQGGRTYRVTGLQAKAESIGTASGELDTMIGDRIDAANKALATWQGKHSTMFAEELNGVLSRMAELRLSLWSASRALWSFPNAPEASPGAVRFIDGIYMSACVEVPASTGTASATPLDLRHYASTGSGQDERFGPLATAVNLDGVTAEVTVSRPLNAVERQELVDAGVPHGVIDAETASDTETMTSGEIAALITLPDPDPLVLPLLEKSGAVGYFTSNVALAFEQSDFARLDYLANHPITCTSSEILGRQLAAARAMGLHPSEYADLLQQYWLAVAAEKAGIDLCGWDPSLGADAMLPYLIASYRYYGQLYLDNPNFQWAGMAGMIGPTFAGGMFDLQMFGEFADILSGPLDAVPDWAKGPLLALMPAPLRDLAVLGELGEAEFQYFETSLLSMQKQIFVDQVPMHEAYMAMGMAGLEEMRAAGLIDDFTLEAWRDIDSGDPDRVASGNTDLLYREQHDIIRDDYDDMRNHHPPVGQVMTYMMGAIGTPGIPGAQPYGEYDPLTLGVEIDPWGPGPHAGVEVETPFPAGNISNFDTRWDLIENDTMPAYQELLREDPELVRQILSSDVSGRIDDARLHNNLDELLARFSDWEIRVDGGLW